MIMPHQEETDCLEHLPSTHDLVMSLAKGLLDIDGVWTGDSFLEDSVKSSLGI